ncbi:hypothetical protein SKAU_G00054860 [Synaphobranchus kaupii]|uniref:Uncharacterized protein n=1 Tax=Synaphobranchus kaupii TaxID=118154 RepID=A0A9Q1G477_SYNKA|nr:hypothetical protein SKAU_G00054860 [Synaphobranchus kaupii]
MRRESTRFDDRSSHEGASSRDAKLSPLLRKAVGPGRRAETMKQRRDTETTVATLSPRGVVHSDDPLNDPLRLPGPGPGSKAQSSQTKRRRKCGLAARRRTRDGSPTLNRRRPPRHRSVLRPPWPLLWFSGGGGGGEARCEMDS